MTWTQGKGAVPGHWHWLGPMKVVVHENAQTIWTTMSCKLYRCAPEHVRPVSAQEARAISINSHEQFPRLPNNFQYFNLKVQPEPLILQMKFQLKLKMLSLRTIHTSLNRLANRMWNLKYLPTNPIDPPTVTIPKTSSPDGSIHTPPNDNPQINDPAVNTPVPDDNEDGLTCEGLLCLDIDECLFASDHDLAWRCEIPVLEKDIQEW